MKKKLILSVVCTILLSLGAMAKSDVKTNKSKTSSTKIVHLRQSEQAAKSFLCVPVTLSCGLRGWACGDTFVDVLNNALAVDEMYCQ